VSALIWLAIVGVWGFVLIPMWLRRHDGAFEQRSADRLSTAMRVLSRRGAGSRPDAEFGPDALDADDVDDLESTLELSTGPIALDPTHAEAATSTVDAADERGPDKGADGAAELGDGVPVDRRAGAIPPPNRGAGPADTRTRLTAAEHAMDGDEPDETRHTVPVDAGRLMARSTKPTDSDRRTLLRLRRQRLVVLVGAVPVTIGLAIGLAGMWIVVQALVDVGLGVYVAHLRRAAQTEHRLAASRAARDKKIAVDRAARRAARTALTGAPVRATPPVVPRTAPARPAGSQSAAGRPHAAAPTRPASAGEYAPVRLSEEGTAGRGAEEPAAGPVAPVPFAPAEPAVAEPAVAAPAASAPGQPDDVYVNNVRVTGARPVGRPGVRPPTSRPGRVQVNPPGTHGGLTASPSVAAPAVAASAPPKDATKGADADIRPLRPAVGG
jgi:hypothetical protein